MLYPERDAIIRHKRICHLVITLICCEVQCKGLLGFVLDLPACLDKVKCSCTKVQSCFELFWGLYQQIHNTPIVADYIWANLTLIHSIKEEKIEIFNCG